MTQMCRVLYLYAFGFPVAWERSIIPKKHCDLRSQKKAHVKVKGEQPSIKLTELSGAFLVLGVGLSFAFLVFLIEKIVAVWKENTTTEIELITIDPKAKEGEEVVETALNKAENGIIELVIAPQDTANKQDEITEPTAPATNEEIIETAIATTESKDKIDSTTTKKDSTIEPTAVDATSSNKNKIIVKAIIEAVDVTSEKKINVPIPATKTTSEEKVIEATAKTVKATPKPFVSNKIKIDDGIIELAEVPTAENGQTKPVVVKPEESEDEDLDAIIHEILAEVPTAENGPDAAKPEEPKDEEIEAIIHEILHNDKIIELAEVPTDENGPDAAPDFLKA